MSLLQGHSSCSSTRTSAYSKYTTTLTLNKSKSVYIRALTTYVHPVYSNARVCSRVRLTWICLLVEPVYVHVYINSLRTLTMYVHVYINSLRTLTMYVHVYINSLRTLTMYVHVYINSLRTLTMYVHVYINSLRTYITY